MIYWQLYYEFFKTGLFAIGGGMATLPFLYDIADRIGWFSRSDLADMLAVSESTPGPIGVNMATYAGYSAGGVPGAVIATLGLITPSVIVILLVSAFLKSFRDNRYVVSVFYGLRPVSAAMIANAGINICLLQLFRVGQTGIAFFNLPCLALAAVLLVFTRWVPKVKEFHPLVFIAFGAVVGVVFQL